MKAILVNGKMMRRGYTTGSCAAAAAKAAATMLLTQALCHTVTLTTANKTVLTLDVLNACFTALKASCAVQKDSGDDPDITNGALVCAEVSFADSGIEITGGKGIGLVTKPGLDQPVGACAINTTPRRVIKQECEAICLQNGYRGGLRVVISIPDGEELAKRTFNPKLGIIGGISILGTTGIVEPMSEKAITETIRAQLSLLYEAGHRNILLTIGNYGEAFARDVLRLPFTAHVTCSNHIGETLTMAAEKGFTNALLVGHIGKLVKLGIGITNTHSNQGDGRIETLIACALEAGAELKALRKIRECVTTDAAAECIFEAGLLDKTMNLLCERIDETLKRLLSGYMQIRFVCFRGMGDKAQICFQNY
ncbi:MAG: cobalt-precorrin-5B (C(1))-methyltransferase CbiD [Clostridiales bacterium]|nr:cobalt-precorrin-5B (C(1))-methyltransferase CbiD [Clostridiales bacterium]